MSKQKLSLDTDKQKKGARRIMAMLTLSDIPRRKAVQKLTQKVTIQDDHTGEIRTRPRIYKRTSQASELVKSLVKSSRFPVEKDGKFLTRTDLDNTGETA